MNKKAKKLVIIRNSVMFRVQWALILKRGMGTISQCFYILTFESLNSLDSVLTFLQVPEVKVIYNLFQNIPHVLSN